MKRMTFGFILLVICCIFSGCSNMANGINKSNYQENTLNPSKATTNSNLRSLINTSGKTVYERIKLPEGFERVQTEEKSYGQYLRSLPLKPDGTSIKLYNGEIKNSDKHAAVLDIDVDDRNLQQCADSIMRLRAEYLYKQKDYKKIHFNFTNGFEADYTSWMNGNRVHVNGNKVNWVRNEPFSSEYSSFRKYLNVVFSYAGTLSLSRELEKVSIEDMRIGDVFIKGGTPGHAVIILDMAKNKKTGEKIFIIAQGYMPAQDMHILKNLQDEELSPWYKADFGENLETPDWQFERDQLMRFKEQ